MVDDEPVQMFRFLQFLLNRDIGIFELLLVGCILDGDKQFIGSIGVFDEIIGASF